MSRAANTYITPMPCLYFSLIANASTKSENVPFIEAQLGSHLLSMYSISWQDQYNHNNKGMMLMDLHLLLILLKVIERVCTHETAKLKFSKRLLTRTRKGRSILVPSLWPGFSRRSILRSIVTCARSMGACIPHTILVIVICFRKTERRNLVSVPLRKAVRKPIPLIRTSCS